MQQTPDLKCPGDDTLVTDPSREISQNCNVKTDEVDSRDKWGMTVKGIFEALEHEYSIRKPNPGLGKLKWGLEYRF
jgi:hypothetical protein